MNLKSYHCRVMNGSFSFPAFLCPCDPGSISFGVRRDHLLFPPGALRVRWILGHCCIQGWALIVCRNFQAISTNGIVRRAGQNEVSYIFFFFLFFFKVHPHASPSTKEHQSDSFWSVFFWPCLQSQCVLHVPDFSEVLLKSCGFIFQAVSS